MKPKIYFCKKHDFEKYKKKRVSPWPGPGYAAAAHPSFHRCPFHGGGGRQLIQVAMAVGLRAMVASSTPPRCRMLLRGGERGTCSWFSDFSPYSSGRSSLVDPPLKCVAFSCLPACLSE